MTLAFSHCLCSSLTVNNLVLIIYVQTDGFYLPPHLLSVFPLKVNKVYGFGIIFLSINLCFPGG